MADLAHIFHPGRADEAFSSHVIDEFNVGGAAASPSHDWGKRLGGARRSASPPPWGHSRTSRTATGGHV